MQKKWLLHMTEAQRIYAVGLLDAVLDFLGSPVDILPTRSPEWTRLSLTGLPGRRTGASVTLSRGRVFLRTPLSPKQRRFAAEIVGPACSPIDVIADGDVAVILVTLAGWRRVLSSAVTAETMADADAIASAYTSLLRGAVHAHCSDWEMATVQSSRKDGHVVKLFGRDAEGRQVGERFASKPGVGIDHVMSEELAAEMDHLGGSRSHAHVVELATWQRYRLRLHATPEYLISPTQDPLLTLRAFNALPAGAQLSASN